jgi:hypothetical protein
MVDRNVGPGVLECVTTLWHTIIGRQFRCGARYPKSAVAQGDSRRRPSFLVVATAGLLVAPQRLRLGERRAPLAWVVAAPAGRQVGAAFAAARLPPPVPAVVGRLMARAGLEAAGGPVVGPVLGRGDHGQVSDFDAAHVAAPGVVHIFPDLDAPAEVRGHDDPGGANLGAGDLHARAPPAGGQRGNQAAVVVTVGASQESCGDVGQDRDWRSWVHTLSGPGASPAGGPQGLPVNCLENACEGSNTELKAQRNHLWEVI